MVESVEMKASTAQRVRVSEWNGSRYPSNRLGRTSGFLLTRSQMRPASFLFVLLANAIPGAGAVEVVGRARRAPTAGWKYASDAEGNRVPDFSHAGYRSGAAGDDCRRSDTVSLAPTCSARRVRR